MTPNSQYPSVLVNTIDSLDYAVMPLWPKKELISHPYSLLMRQVSLVNECCLLNFPLLWPIYMWPIQREIYFCLENIFSFILCTFLSYTSYTTFTTSIIGIIRQIIFSVSITVKKWFLIQLLLNHSLHAYEYNFVFLLRAISVDLPMMGPLFLELY